MRRALIKDAHVVAVVRRGEEYVVPAPLYWLSCPDRCETFTWRLDADGQLVDPNPPPTAQQETERLEQVGDARWALDHVKWEDGRGVTVGEKAAAVAVLRRHRVDRARKHLGDKA